MKQYLFPLPFSKCCSNDCRKFKKKKKKLYGRTRTYSVGPCCHLHKENVLPQFLCGLLPCLLLRVFISVPHPLSTRPPPSPPRLCSSTFSPPKHKHTLLLLSTETSPKNMQSALKALVYQQSLTQWCEESPNCSNQDQLASQVVLNYVLKYKSKVGLRWWNRPHRNLTCPWCFTKRKPVQQSSAASIKGSGHTPTPNWSVLVPLDIRRLLRF